MFGTQQSPFGPFGPQVTFPTRRRWGRPVGPWTESRWARRRRRAKQAYRAGRWMSRKGWTHRRGLAPVYAAAGLLALGAVGHYVPHGAPATWALWAFVTVVLGTRVARRMRRKAYRRAQWAYIAATYLTATGWLAAMTAAGPVVPVRVALALWFAAAGAPWWHQHWVRPHIEVQVSVDDRIADWDEYASKLVAGAELTNVTDLPDPQQPDRIIGWHGELIVPKGRKIGSLLQYSQEIAGVYDDQVDSVADLDLEATGPRRGTIAVYTDNPLRRVAPWPGPEVFDPETGVAQVGVYADGTSALYRFYHRHNGPVHDLIAGTTGSGKSQFISSLLAIERAHPFMASVVIDPQRGQSLPDWKNSTAKYARSVDEGGDLLYAVRDELYRRNEILANVRWKDDKGRWREGVDHFDALTGPAADLGLPLICVTIEEAHAFNGTGLEPVIEDMAKMFRKCGGKLRLALQVPLLDQLPGSTTLRDMLVGGNVANFRTANKLTQQVSFNGIDLGDPSLLPREWPDGSSTGGLGYILGPKPRSAKVRTFYLADSYHWATTGQTTPLPTVVEAAERYRLARVELADKGSATVAPAATAAQLGTIADRAIAWLNRHPEGIATTGTIADALGLSQKLPSVSQALKRASKAGRVQDLGHALWGRLEDVNAEDLAAVGAA